MTALFQGIDVHSFGAQIPVASLAMQTVYLLPNQSQNGVAEFKIGRFAFGWNGDEFPSHRCQQAYTLARDNPHLFGEVKRFLRNHYPRDAVETVAGPETPLMFGG